MVLFTGQPHITQYSHLPRQHYPHCKVMFLIFTLPSTLLWFYHLWSNSFHILGAEMKIITLCPDYSPEQASPLHAIEALSYNVNWTGASGLQFAPSWSVGVQLHTSAPGHYGAWKQEKKHEGRGKRRAKSQKRSQP